MPYLSTDKAAAFQSFYSTILLVEDFRPDYIASSLHSATLPRSFALLPGSPSIYGPTPSPGPMPEPEKNISRLPD